MIADVFSGLALNVEHPFSVGDWIETAFGVTGKVLDANWRAVHLVTIEGRVVVVPNSVLANSQFINLNAPRRHFRLKKTICLDYSAPADRIVPIFQAAMEATAGVLTDPKSIVLIDECNDRGVVYSLNFWVSDYPDSFPISRQVVVNALKFLDQDGLAPAYPKRDITIAKAIPRQLDSRIDVPTVLARVPLLQTLGPEAIQTLERSAHVHEYPDRRIIINEGDPGSSLFVVIAGLLEASQCDASGGQRAVGRLLPGDVFGEISLLTGAPRIASVTALTAVTLVEIDKHHLQLLFDAHPEMIARLTDIEAARLLANRNAAHLRPEVQARIESMGIGLAEYLRQRILQLFGRGDA
jgi:CRP-like cAMP-binding protein